MLDELCKNTNPENSPEIHLSHHRFGHLLPADVTEGLKFGLTAYLFL